MIPNSALTIDLDNRIARWSGEIYSGGTCAVTITSSENIGSYDLRLALYEAKFDGASTLVAGITSVSNGTYSRTVNLDLNTDELATALSDYLNGQQVSFLLVLFKYDLALHTPEKYLFKKYIPVTCWINPIDSTSTTTPVEAPTERFGNRKTYEGDTYVYDETDGRWHKETVIGSGDEIRYVLDATGIDLP